jgi:hypothetical protein
MDRFCYACGMPLPAETKGDFCQYCAGPDGKPKPYEEIRAGIAQWLSTWGPEKPGIDWQKRAESYLKAMPAWADR